MERGHVPAQPAAKIRKFPVKFAVLRESGRRSRAVELAGCFLKLADELVARTRFDAYYGAAYRRRFPAVEGGWVVFTCVIRHQVEPGKLVEFREYAHAWIALIRKYGGDHHGYFVPGTDKDNLPNAAFSFPGLGTAGPPNIAIALFSFPSVEAYGQYRAAVAEDEDCKAATARFNETRCFSGYERSFLVPIFD